MIKKPCFYTEPENCIGKENCICNVDWENCTYGKLSESYKKQEQAKAAVEKALGVTRK